MTHSYVWHDSFTWVHARFPPLSPAGVLPTYVGHKRDLKKRPTKETHKRDQKRKDAGVLATSVPVTQTQTHCGRPIYVGYVCRIYKRDLKKRPTKETHKRDHIVTDLYM